MMQLPLPNIIPEIDERHRTACRKLARIVEKRRNSFEIQDFRRRREAMLKHTRGLKPHPALERVQ